MKKHRKNTECRFRETRFVPVRGSGISRPASEPDLVTGVLAT